jgi:hypothetical protein
MWWMCDVKVCRTRLRLKLWARSEREARAKVERMYLIATIENLATTDNSGFMPPPKNVPATTAYWS